MRRKMASFATSDVAGADRALTYAIDQWPEPVYLIDEKLRLVHLNGSACAWLGRAREVLLGVAVMSIDRRLSLQAGAAFGQRAQGDTASRFESFQRRRDGQIVPVEVMVARIETGGRRMCMAVVRDLTQTREMETRLRDQNAFQQTLLDALCSAGIQMLAIENGRIVYALNDALTRDLGYSESDVAGGVPMLDIIHPDDRALVMQYHSRRLAGDPDVPSSYEVGLVSRRGERREFSVSLAVVPGSEPPRTLSVGWDITARKEHEATLLRHAELEGRLRALAVSMPGVLFSVRLGADGGTSVQYVSPGVENLFGLKPEAVYDDAELLFARYHPDDQPQLRRQLDASAATLTPLVAEVRMLHAGGDLRWIEVRATPQRHGDGAVEWHGMMFDITGVKASEERLHHLELHDALTGLPNRRLLTERLSLAMAEAKSSGRLLAVLYFDIDGFKSLNESHGQAFGDRVLSQIASNLTEALRGADTVARIGGDEFIVLLGDLADVGECELAAARLRKAVARTFDVDGVSVSLSASVGIALYPEEGGDDADSLIRNADQAMYFAKYAGRNQFVFFGGDGRSHLGADMRLLQDLRHALHRGELAVHYQPIVEIASGKVVKAEALLRWRHPTRGAVSPSDFIPVAESGGLIHDIGDFVFTEAARVAHGMNVGMSEDMALRISVNRSPQQFFHRDGVNGWLRHLTERNIPGSLLGVEITESLLLDNRPDIAQQLKQLRDIGVVVSLDDFGTGYSALSYLKKFELDFLKIDRSFVRELVVDSKDRAIVEAIIAMSGRLGIKLIAEGVETREQAEVLRAAGCQMAQGFLYAKPMPEDEFISFVHARAPGREEGVVCS